MKENGQEVEGRWTCDTMTHGGRRLKKGVETEEENGEWRTEKRKSRSAKVGVGKFVVRNNTEYIIQYGRIECRLPSTEYGRMIVNESMD